MFFEEKFGKRDYVLSIDEVTLDDDAEFSVVARNSEGEARCAAQLTVQSAANGKYVIYLVHV